MTKIFSKKGFLGPIGDDLPSLIPLIFALIIFFSTFASTVNVFDSKSREFADSITIMKLSTTLKGDSYFASKQEFLDACKKVETKGVKFKALLLEDFTDKSTGYFDDTVDPLKIAKTPLDDLDSSFEFIVKGDTLDSVGTFSAIACSNLPSDEKISAPANLQMRLFPVAYQDARNNLEIYTAELAELGFIVRPVILMVITWK